MRATLHHGDCLEIMPSLADASIDLILADLPYGTTNCKWDCPIDLPTLWAQYRRLARGAIVLFAQVPFAQVLGCSNLAWLRYEWVWEKTNPTGHLNAKRMPMKAHENILVFYNKLPVYNPQKTSGHVRKQATRLDKSPLYGKQTHAASYDSTERYPRSVLRFPSDKQTNHLHPTQKPVALCEYLIKTYTNPGALVLDNTMGSGTTGVAAFTTGRQFIGIESDAHWFAVAQERITAATHALGAA